MKKIALDLDGVVFDSENLFRVYTEIYDVDVLKGDNIVDNTSRIFQKRYNWSEDHLDTFYNTYAEEVLTTTNVMPGIEIVLAKLKNSFEFIVVTARSDEEVSYGIEVFKELSNMKIYANSKEKINYLLNEKVDYIVDDDENICRVAASNGIKAIYFKNAAANDIEPVDNIKVVNNWGEIYKYLILEEGE